jgi:DNA-binding MarR family transcriptional regulator
VTGSDSGAPGADDFEARAAARVSDLGDDIDVTTFAAMFDLFRASARLISDLENTVHRPAGLSTAGFRVLFTVWVFESLEPRQIAHLSGVSRAAVSGVVATLERDGFVTRTRRTDDRRLISVEPTDAGRAVLASAYQQQNLRERELFSTLSADELAQFTATLRKLLAT